MRRGPDRDTLLVVEGLAANGCPFDRNEAFPRGIFLAVQDFASAVTALLVQARIVFKRDRVPEPAYRPEHAVIFSQNVSVRVNHNCQG